MRSLIITALLALGLAAPAKAQLSGCQYTNGLLTLSKVRSTASGTQIFGCINDSFDRLSSSAAVINSTSSVWTADWLMLHRLSGLATGTVGVQISSYTWFTSSVTVASGIALLEQSFSASAAEQGAIKNFTDNGLTIMCNNDSSARDCTIMDPDGNYRYFQVDADDDVVINETGPGKVGVGTASPDTMFHISGTNPRQTIEIVNNTGLGALAFQDNTGAETATLSYSDNLGDITINRVGVASLTITNAGGLTYAAGEGTDAVLRVSADEGDDNADQWRLWAKASDGTFNLYSPVGAVDGYYLQVDPANSRLIVGESVNEVGIGATPGANYKLDVKGETADSTKYAARFRDSADATLLDVRNDGLVTIGAGKLADSVIYGQDIAASTITLNKLNQSGCSNNDIPKWNGTLWACATDSTGASLTVARATATPSGSGTNTSMTAACISGSTVTLTLSAEGLACGYSGSMSNTSGPGMVQGARMNGEWLNEMSATKGIVDHLNGISSNGTNWSWTWQSTGTYTGTVSVCMTAATASGTWVVPGATNTGLSDLGQFWCMGVK